MVKINIRTYTPAQHATTQGLQILTKIIVTGLLAPKESLKKLLNSATTVSHPQPLYIYNMCASFFYSGGQDRKLIFGLDEAGPPSGLVSVDEGKRAAYVRINAVN